MSENVDFVPSEIHPLRIPAGLTLVQFFEARAQLPCFPTIGTLPAPHLSEITTAVMTRTPGFRCRQPSEKQRHVSASPLRLPSYCRYLLVIHWSPPFFKSFCSGLLLPAAFLISFVIAVCLGHTHWGWPYISDATTM